MPGLVLEDGTWKELSFPSRTSVGREANNDIQYMARSVSKNHAAIHLSFDHTGQKLVEIEDLGSTYGTKVGYSNIDSEMKKLKPNERERINDGTIIKFANASSYYRFLDEKPRNAPVAQKVIPSTANTEEMKDGTQLNVNYNENTNVMNIREGLEKGVLHTESLLSKANTESRDLISSHVHPPPRTSSPGLNDSQGADKQNMTISIQYPQGGQTNPVSITIDPQGQGAAPPQYPSRSSGGGGGNRGSNGGQHDDHFHAHHPHPNRSDQPQHHSMDSQRRASSNYSSREYGPMHSPDRHSDSSRSPGGRNWEGVAFNGQDLSQESGMLSRQVQRLKDDDHSEMLSGGRSGTLRRSGDQDDDEHHHAIPAMLEDSKKILTTVDEEAARSSGAKDRHHHADFQYNAGVGDHGGYAYDENNIDDAIVYEQRHLRNSKSKSRTGGNSTESFPLPVSPGKALFGYRQPGVKDFHEKPSAQLIRRIWPDLKQLESQYSSSRLVEKAFKKIGDVVDRQTGHTGDVNLIPDYDEESEPPTADLFIGEIPAFVTSEAVADRFLDSEETICGKIGGVISELNDLLTQSINGAKIQTPTMDAQDEISKEIAQEVDAALSDLVEDILKEAIIVVEDCREHNLVIALKTAEDEDDDMLRCENGVHLYLDRAAGRLNSLYVIVTDENTKLTSCEKYVLMAYVLHYALTDLDIANALLFSVTKDSELTVDPATGREVVPEGKESDNGALLGIRTNRKSNAPVNTLSLEIDELRRLKGKSRRKGGNAAITAQLQALEVKARQSGFAEPYENELESSLDFFKMPSGKGEQTQRYNAEATTRLRAQEADSGKAFQVKKRALMNVQKALLRCQNRLFQRWCNVIEDEKRGYRMKMMRVLRIRDNILHKKIVGAFWKLHANKMVAYKRKEVDQTSAELRYELCGMQAKVQELSSNNVLAASLHAERALNRELNEANGQLRQTVAALDTRLLDVANAKHELKPSLVRDVLLTREDEATAARREAKCLRDELQTLYDLAIKPPEREPNSYFPKAPIPADNQQAKDPNAAPVPESVRQGRRKDRSSPNRDDYYDYDVDRRPVVHRPHRGELSANNPNRPLVSKDGGGGRNRVLAPTQGHFLDRENREMTNGLSKKDATIIIAKEVRRITEALKKMTEEKDNIGRKLVRDTTKHVQHKLIIQALQRRITDRERSLTALRHLLREKLGDNGLTDLTIALEDMGVGNSALLKDPAALAEIRREGGNDGKVLVQPLQLEGSNNRSRKGGANQPPPTTTANTLFGPPHIPDVRASNNIDELFPLRKRREIIKEKVDDALNLTQPETTDATLTEEEAMKREVMKDAIKRSDDMFGASAKKGRNG